MEEILNWYLTDRNTRVVKQEEDKFWGSFHTRNIYDVGFIGFKAIYTALTAHSLPHNVTHREYNPIERDPILKSINSCTDWYLTWYLKISMHMSHFNTCERIDFEFGRPNEKSEILSYTNVELLKEGIFGIDDRMTVQLFHEITKLQKKEPKNESL